MAVLPDIWYRSPRPVQWLISRVADVVCAQLDSLTTKPTVYIRQMVGEIIGLTEVVDLQKLLGEPELPRAFQQNMPDFPPDDWKDIFSLSRMTKHDLEQALKRHPEMTHLRRARQQR